MAATLEQFDTEIFFEPRYAPGYRRLRNPERFCTFLETARIQHCQKISKLIDVQVNAARVGTDLIDYSMNKPHNGSLSVSSTGFG
ncbi:hypothetical protein [uncultured Parasphingorhabdus sp.]|uniref:hypothetical protein n=1 Tax=uncultured Parasphingorhabdus sp. TaxID=2709694 RepID=UPI0030D7114A|tara:strand:- start:48659 stop:48913 length:255 start_codon:yes stop_codon:yes gene_type:complete